MNEKGAPTPVAWTRLRAPQSLMAAADPAAMEAAVKASPLFAKYAEPVDRESAYEVLAAKLEAGAAKAAAEEQAKAEQRSRPDPAPTARKAPAGRSKPEKSIVEEVVTSTTFRQVMRTAAREIVRGMFKTGRR
jgi:hypothetical protein